MTSDQESTTGSTLGRDLSAIAVGGSALAFFFITRESEKAARLWIQVLAAVIGFSIGVLVVSRMKGPSETGEDKALTALAVTLGTVLIPFADALSTLLHTVGTAGMAFMLGLGVGGRVFARRE